MKALLVAGAMLLALSACSSVDIPDNEMFALAMINEGTLPGPHPAFEHLEITSGSLRLHDDGRLTVETVARCKSNLPPGTTCAVEGDGRVTSEGSYSLAEGWVQFETPPWQLSGAYLGEFESDRVRITYSRSASHGFAPPYRFEFRR